MSLEQLPKPNVNPQELPQEVTIDMSEPEFKTVPEGSHLAGLKYEYEKDGQYYGGDFLKELPQEVNIDSDLPKAPVDQNSII